VKYREFVERLKGHGVREYPAHGLGDVRPGCLYDYNPAVGVRLPRGALVGAAAVAVQGRRGRRVFHGGAGFGRADAPRCPSPSIFLATGGPVLVHGRRAGLPSPWPDPKSI